MFSSTASLASRPCLRVFPSRMYIYILVFVQVNLIVLKVVTEVGFFFLLCFPFVLPFFLSIFLLLVSNFHFFMFVLAFKLSVSCLLLIFYFYFLIFFSFLLFFVKGSMSKHKKSCFCSFGFLDYQMNYGIIK